MYHQIARKQAASAKSTMLGSLNVQEPRVYRKLISSTINFRNALVL